MTTEIDPRAVVRIENDGTITCRGCGAQYKASDREVIEFDLKNGREFVKRHLACIKKVN